LNDPIEVLLGNTVLIEEVSHLISIVTLLNHSVDALFFSQGSISIKDSHHICHFLSHFVPNLDGLSILKLFRVWLDSFLLKEVSHLLWQFSQDLLGQSNRVTL